MKSVIDFKSIRLPAAFGLVLIFLLSYQPVSAVTNYMFFSINGDTSRTSMVQGDNVSWGANCDTGATLTWEIWIDLNLNGVIDSLLDLRVTSFDATDGDTSSNGPPPDINPIPDGWYISQPMILGVAPGQYIFRVRNHIDNSVVQRAVVCNALPSPPNMFRGRVTIAGHPAPDSVHLRNIWVEASPDGNGAQIWSGLTNSNGLYQINVGAAGSGLQFRIRPADISGYVTPGDQIRTASGVIDSVNFHYSAPADSLYGNIRDGFGALIMTSISGSCEPRFPGPGRKDFTAINGLYKVYFGQSEYGPWNAGLSPENLVPAYLCPNGFDFDNSIVHSLHHNFICYNTDAVIYARVTEVGGNPTHHYLVLAQSQTLQSGTFAISGTGDSNLVTLHISSLDQSSWNVNVSNWDNRFPIPPGYVLDGRDQYWNRQPGDTVSLNFIFGNMVRDTVRIDPGDASPGWNNVWVNLFRNGSSYGGNPDNNGVFTIYADTGTYMMNVNCNGYLAAPSNRDVHLTADTTGGLGFMLNAAHCRVTGALINVPTPIPGPVSIFAHTGNGNEGYGIVAQVDSVSGTFVMMLCDGNWTIDPPFIPNRIQPAPLNLIIGERPDTSRTANLVYQNQQGIDNLDGTIPEEFALNQNYPNPFNAQTIIEYGLPKASHVNIEIYDLLGRKVDILFDGQQQAGYYQLIWNAAKAPSGIYFYRIKADQFAQMRKMLLLK